MPASASRTVTSVPSADHDRMLGVWMGKGACEIVGFAWLSCCTRYTAATLDAACKELIFHFETLTLSGDFIKYGGCVERFARQIACERLSDYHMLINVNTLWIRLHLIKLKH